VVFLFNGSSNKALRTMQQKKVIVPENSSKAHSKS
jgi:hypothetical protein